MILEIIRFLIRLPILIVFILFVPFALLASFAVREPMGKARADLWSLIYFIATGRLWEERKP
jgi:hypothetical protein